ncbi:DNA-directed DNA polymerase [Bertholletia excelsa]
MKPSDWSIVQKLKAEVQSLPDLQIPPEKAYIIIETDGCMTGWGAVCKWKTAKTAPRKEESISAYASGKFPTTKSTIDAEIYACINALTALKIHYLDKDEITLRTDCQAIISFYSKMAHNKPSRVRWINFMDYITGTSVKINIEHIDGKNNILADHLSRLVYLCIEEEDLPWQQIDLVLSDALKKEDPPEKVVAFTCQILEELYPHWRIPLNEKLEAWKSGQSLSSRKQNIGEYVKYSCSFKPGEHRRNCSSSSSSRKEWCVTIPGTSPEIITPETWLQTSEDGSRGSTR